MIDTDTLKPRIYTRFYVDLGASTYLTCREEINKLEEKIPGRENFVILHALMYSLGQNNKILSWGKSNSRTPMNRKQLANFLKEGKTKNARKYLHLLERENIIRSKAVGDSEEFYFNPIYHISGETVSDEVFELFGLLPYEPIISQLE